VAQEWKPSRLPNVVFLLTDDHPQAVQDIGE
jgi:hypothetical protein